MQIWSKSEQNFSSYRVTCEYYTQIWHILLSKNSLKIVNFKILKIPFVCFFLYPKDIFILNFRQIGEKTAEEMSGNHSVHGRTTDDGRTDGRRTDGHDESNIPPYQLRWAGGIKITQSFNFTYHICLYTHD